MNYIYAIRNLINNKIYVGSTKSIIRRKYSHFYLLRKNKHHSPHLQFAFNKYGEKNFSFELLEECELENRKEREIYYINLYNCCSNDGYNTFEPNGNDFQCSKETIEKIKNTNYIKNYRIAVDVYNKSGELLNSFESMKECSKFLSIHLYIISDFLNKSRKSYKGYIILRKGEKFNYKPSSKERNMTKFYKS